MYFHDPLLDATTGLAGATTGLNCSLCQAGTYWTGSGQDALIEREWKHCRAFVMSAASVELSPFWQIAVYIHRIYTLLAIQSYFCPTVKGGASGRIKME